MAAKRREFLVAAGAAPLALALTGQSGSRELTADEQANLDVVNDFCAAWETRDADNVVSFVAEDVVFRFTHDGDILNGRQTMHERAAGILGNATEVEFAMLETYAFGPLVVNLRVDYFTNADGERRGFRVAGVFYVRDGRIVEWIDALLPADEA